MPLSVQEFVNCGRKYKVTTIDDQAVLYLGNAADGRPGVMVIQWVPDPSFNGSFGVVARIYGKPANDDNVGFATVVYRRVVLNGVASDRNLVSDPIGSSFTIIEVPANGLAIALQANVNQGFGTLYSWPLVGPAT